MKQGYFEMSEWRGGEHFQSESYQTVMPEDNASGFGMWAHDTDSKIWSGFIYDPIQDTAYIAASHCDVKGNRKGGYTTDIPQFTNEFWNISKHYCCEELPREGETVFFASIERNESGQNTLGWFEVGMYKNGGFYGRHFDKDKNRVENDYPAQDVLCWWKLPDQADSTGINLPEFTSSHITNVIYYPLEGRLVVHYNTPGVYHYSDISANEWQMIKEAESKGSIIHKVVKGKPFTKIGTE